MIPSSSTRICPAAAIFLLATVIVGCAGPAVDSRTERAGSTLAGVAASMTGERSSSSTGRFASMTSEGEADRRDDARRWLADLRSIDTSLLSVHDRIDWLVLESECRRRIADSVLSTGERMPSRYLQFGTLSWLHAEPAPVPEDRWRRLHRELRSAPEALAIGRQRLSAPPPLWVGLAANASLRFESILLSTLPGRIRSEAPVSIRDSLLEAAQVCGEALRRFRIFLTDSLVAGPEDSWRAGEDYYNWLLREYHTLPYDAEGMIAEGRRLHDETVGALEALAAAAAPGRSWRDLVASMKEIHPAPDSIMFAYADESRRAERLIRERVLLAIPPAETLLFVPTPPSLRETYAWGGYGGIELRDSVMTGRFFVTDIVPGMSDQEIREKLRTQNTGWLTVIALHEGYPGHHLQSVYARLHPRPVRSSFGSTYFGEGWALYCESWMGREGFYTDVWDSLGWLNMRLWRTARVIVDPSLHTGRMSYEDAVRFMMNDVGLERSAAEAEVNRYTTWPTQAPSYIIGWVELERLRRDLTREHGGRLTERAFAEAVLRTGSLPPRLMARAVRYDLGAATAPHRE